MSGAPASSQITSISFLSHLSTFRFAISLASRGCCPRYVAQILAFARGIQIFLLYFRWS